MNLYLDNLKIIDQNDNELLVPIRDVHTLILDNYKAVLTVQLINKLTDENVNVIACGVDHMPASLFFPIEGNAQAALMLKKQLKWSTYIKEFIQKEIVQAKIYNQLELLKYFNKDNFAISKLDEYYNDVSIGDKTNREGLSAKFILEHYMVKVSSDLLKHREMQLLITVMRS